nr:DNA translocase FtsK [Halorhodospira abdelmalekii]
MLGHQLSRRLREAGMVLLTAVGAFVLLALLSYNPEDPTWRSSSVSEQHVANLGGLVGALLADGVFFLLGHLAYLLPLLIGVAAYRLYYHHSRGTLEARWLLTRVGGGVLVLLAGAALASLNATGAGMPEGAGGLVGVLVGGALYAVLGFTGACLIASALLLAGVTLSTGLSWLAVSEWVGGWTLAAVERLRTLFSGHGQGHRFERLAEYRWQLQRWAADHPWLVYWRNRFSSPATDLPRIGPPHPVTADQRGGIPEGILDRVTPSAAEAVTTPSEEVSRPAASPPPRATARRGREDEASQHSSPEVQRVHAPAPAAQTQEKRRAEPRPVAVTDPLPPIDLLDSPPERKGGYSQETLDSMSRLLEEKLADFGVSVEVESVQPGPVITRFEIVPAAGVKVSRITNLSKDLARAMSVIAVRVIEVIPGKSTVGLEIPNEQRQLIGLSEIIRSKAYSGSVAPLTVTLGHDIGGQPKVADLAKMPHLLVAGTTGSGKSVGINAMILSLLYRNSAEQVRMIMVDPKMLELSVYDGIPHLLAPVVTDMNDAANALRWCVAEMERRYRLMAAMGVRNITGFNQKVRRAREAGEPLRDPLFDAGDPQQATLEDEVPQAPELEELPLIVVVVDELADMMMIVGKKVEELIARLAQKARAAGIHLILATQRPSVDVITGLIKANIPTRIAFQVSSRVDSRTILDQQGAEALLGHGDMLFLPPGSGMPQRVHGAFVSDAEVHRVVEYLKQLGEPDYVDGVLQETAETTPIPGIPGEGNGGGSSGESDPLYDQAVQIVTESRRASISGVQRRLKIGYNRAARLVEEMEAAGVVGPLQSNGAREVIAPPPPPEP